MKTETLLILAVGIFAGYYFWYKPKKEAEAAATGAATETAKKAAAEVASAVGMLQVAPIWTPQTADSVAT